MPFKDRFTAHVKIKPKDSLQEGRRRVGTPTQAAGAVSMHATDPSQTGLSAGAGPVNPSSAAGRQQVSARDIDGREFIDNLLAVRGFKGSGGFSTATADGTPIIWVSVPPGYTAENVTVEISGGGGYYAVYTDVQVDIEANDTLFWVQVTDGIPQGFYDVTVNGVIVATMTPYSHTTTIEVTELDDFVYLADSGYAYLTDSGELLLMG